MISPLELQDPCSLIRIFGRQHAISVNKPSSTESSPKRSRILLIQIFFTTVGKTHGNSILALVGGRATNKKNMNALPRIHKTTETIPWLQTDLPKRRSSGSDRSNRRGSTRQFTHYERSCRFLSPFPHLFRRICPPFSTSASKNPTKIILQELHSNQVYVYPLTTPNKVAVTTV